MTTTTSTAAKKTTASKPAAKKPTPAKKAATKPATIYKAQTLQQVPPGALVLERNIRDAQPDERLIASVKDLGVLQPIVAVTNNDGQLVVRLGHRRTLAALSAGLDVVPVYVAGDDDTDAAAEIIRVISQHDENTLRAGLTAGDDLHVVEQLAAFGLTVDQMVDQARLGKEQVDTAMRVSRSRVAASATEKYSEVTLDQAATLAEFEDDNETVKALVVAAVKEPASFEHVAQRARDERIRETYRATLVAELEAAGVKLVKQPEYSDKTTALHRLRDGSKKITAADHKDCKGNVAWLGVEWRWVDEDGVVHADRADDRRSMQVAEVEYGCKDPKTYGHTDTWSSSSTSRPPAAGMSEADREKAKAARRLVIENNQAWDAATVVRHQWLKTFAGCKSAPKGAAAFIATALVSDQSVITHYKAAGVTLEVFGIKDTGYRALQAHIVKELKGASEARALVLALLPILGAYESMADRSAWRQDGTKSHAGRYLQFLQSAGYPLSDVEKFALSSKTVS